MEQIKSTGQRDMSIISRYRNVIMGLSILSIIIFHYTDDCRIYDYYFSGIKYGYNYWISSSAVEIFLVMSGFGLYYAFSRNDDRKLFYRKRFSRVLIPYVLVATPALVWRNLFFTSQGIGSVLADLSFVSFFTMGRSWFWYILASMICYLIFPCVYRVYAEAQDETTEQMRTLAFFLFFTVLAVVLKSEYPDYFSRVNLLLLRMPAFFFGVQLGKASYEKRPIRIPLVLCLLFALAVIQVRGCEQVLVTRYALGYLNLLACFLLILGLDRLSGTKVHDLFCRGIGWVGTYSLELYLTHVAVRGVLCYMKYETCHLRYEALMLVISLVLSLILKRLTNMIAKAILR